MHSNLTYMPNFIGFARHKGYLEFKRFEMSNAYPYVIDSSIQTHIFGANYRNVSSIISNTVHF